MKNVAKVKTYRKTSIAATAENGKGLAVKAVRPEIVVGGYTIVKKGRGVVALKAVAEKAAPTQQRGFATHQDLLDDMKAFGQRLTETPGAAREFLISAGLLTKSGKPKQLIRG